MKQTICSVGDAILLERFPESYVCERNKQFGTIININGKVIEVKLK